MKKVFLFYICIMSSLYSSSQKVVDTLAIWSGIKTVINIQKEEANISADSTVGNVEKEPDTALTIGKKYQGGIIFYIFQPGDPEYIPSETHGLIASPYDQSTSICWHNGRNKKTGATGTVLGTGKTNTNMIVSIQGAGNYAAKICYDLLIDGYSDWYLPSIDELNKLYISKGILDNLHDTYYWSSSESDNENAWNQYFLIGLQHCNYKRGTYCVRAIRSF